MVLTSGLKKIIGTKAFYKAALAFAIPLILQDTVSSFVNLLDNMMIGSLGTEQMSGVAIVNQFINLFTMCIYGGVAGANFLLLSTSATTTIKMRSMPFASTSSWSPAFRRFSLP